MAAYAETTSLRESESRDLSDAAPVPKQASFEENVLHALDEQGLDVEALESYVKDDVERLGTKLGVMHERMKAHLADLLVSVAGHLQKTQLTKNSGLLLIHLRLARMALVLSMITASSLHMVILLMTLEKTSSVSRSLVWTANSA